jgi:hypothetical protein
MPAPAELRHSQPMITHMEMDLKRCRVVEGLVKMDGKRQ